MHVTGKAEQKEIDLITSSSANVKSNSLFVAVKGFKTDGHKYIQDAINKGASAIVLEDNSILPDEYFVSTGIVKILVADSRKALAEISNSFYGDPSKKIKLVAVTGTKGKTTTTYYIKNIFDNAGYKSGLIGTNKNIVGDKIYTTKLTTPESNVINELMNEMVKEGCEYCVMEVSSHSLDLKRVYGLDFDAAVFTNITSDHLDYHVNFENYLSAKKILFDELKKDAAAIVNKDDRNWKELIKNTKANIKGYAFENDAEIKIKNIEYDLSGTSFEIEYVNKSYSINTKLIGMFNAYNATAAFGACVKLGIDANVVIEGIKNTPQVPGRFEVVGNGNKKVIVDYSHTADSLEKALHAVHHIVKNERPIYTVFGCGGDRDKTKRPVMGKIANELSDKVIITSDNPRTENPLLIIEDILKGVNGNKHIVQADREAAIKFAIQNSEDNAVILIAGKGHEDYQEINGVRTHFSDKEVAEKYLNQ
ncbi:MAG: UDP-N-acetylmuramoyl-L-alanyl-D-glutamate--2,6-diaminopimelate ligase [Melioribacteraceae bacterium]|nr:MAG: UDP-N-acetylmuramoyl-L-alanyl-D-glutamate--2,6-diaminopimelate ligase [Melioribacteraceae bacterium]